MATYEYTTQDVEYLRHGGMPSFDNWEAYAPPGAGLSIPGAPA